MIRHIQTIEDKSKPCYTTKLHLACLIKALQKEKPQSSSEPDLDMTRASRVAERSLQPCSCASSVAGVVKPLIDSAGDVDGLLSTMGMPGTLEYLEVCS